MAHVAEDDRMKCTVTDSIGSKLPKAREFKHWVTVEVLPQIRKKGGYKIGAAVLKAIKAGESVVDLNSPMDSESDSDGDSHGDGNPSGNTPNGGQQTTGNGQQSGGDPDDSGLV